MTTTYTSERRSVRFTVTWTHANGFTGSRDFDLRDEATHWFDKMRALPEVLAASLTPAEGR